MAGKMKEEPLSERIVQYILSSEPDRFATLNAAKLAEMFKLNQSYLTSQFQKEMHYTLDFYLSQIKMFKVYYALSKPEYDKLSITDISNRLGFDSQEHFNSVFKDHFGINPHKFRQVLRQANNKCQ